MSMLPGTEHQPKVTIVTACYNRAATIRETIESVLAQDYDNVEYIIIDGASTDGTQRIVEEYASRLAHFLSEPDHGMYELWLMRSKVHRRRWFMPTGFSFVPIAPMLWYAIG